MMEVLTQTAQIFFATLKWLFMLGIFFALLEQIIPCNPGVAWWKNLRGTVTDLIYWLIVPLFLRYIRWAMLIMGALLVVGVHDPVALKEFFSHGYGGYLSQLPFLTQCILILLIQDAFMYWVHRIFHTRIAWPFHAIHHSTITLNWLSTQRFHPVNSLLEFALADVLALMIGFSPAALLALAPFNIVFSALVHSNLRWNFGPFKYLLASPIFHRWHHTFKHEGGMKNFAPTFPFLDVIFGTFYMPKDKLPQVYGIAAANFPTNFWGQLVYPFKPKKNDEPLLTSNSPISLSTPNSQN